MTTKAELSTMDKQTLFEHFDSLIDNPTNFSKVETPILVGLLDYLHTITRQGFCSQKIANTLKDVHHELNQVRRYYEMV